MSIYSRYVFPWLLDHVLVSPQVNEQRRLALSPAAGEVLEIGLGTGLNLPFYPPGVERLTAIDPNAGMTRRAAPRAAAASVPVSVLSADAAELPLPDASFDTVVSTWTMCSIAALPAALREVHRVLRPGGRLLFVEHGLSPSPRVAKWQRRLTPINRRLADGCHLDRDIARLISESPLEMEICETLSLAHVPQIAGFLYRGVARKL
jgi:ubiquinone/menaquinone biosynthesis C-methylase UbiE